MSSDELRLTGFLFKKSPKGIHPWQKRFFELSDGVLIWKKNRTDPKALNTLKLSSVIACPIHGKEFKLVIDLGKTYVLKASSNNEAEMWVRMIVKQMGLVRASASVATTRETPDAATAPLPQIGNGVDGNKDQPKKDADLVSEPESTATSAAPTAAPTVVRTEMRRANIPEKILKELPRKEGYMHKQTHKGPKGMKKWLRRWYELDAGVLNSKDSPRSIGLHGCISMHTVAGVSTADKRGGTCIILDMGPHKPGVVLKAGSETEAAEWLQALELSRELMVKAATEAGDLAVSGESRSKAVDEFDQSNPDDLRKDIDRKFVGLDMFGSDLARLLENADRMLDDLILDLEDVAYLSIPRQDVMDFYVGEYHRRLVDRLRPFIHNVSDHKEGLMLIAWVHHFYGMLKKFSKTDLTEKLTSDAEWEQLTSEFAPHMEGYIDKQSPKGTKGMKGWQQRWFVLENCNLSYYKKKGDENPCNTIRVDSIQQVSWNHRGFKLDMGNRVFYLRTADESEQIQWVMAINKSRGVATDRKAQRRLTALIQQPQLAAAETRVSEVARRFDESGADAVRRDIKQRFTCILCGKDPDAEKASGGGAGGGGGGESLPPVAEGDDEDNEGNSSGSERGECDGGGSAGSGTSQANAPRDSDRAVGAGHDDEENGERGVDDANSDKDSTDGEGDGGSVDSDGEDDDDDPLHATIISEDDLKVLLERLSLVVDDLVSTGDDLIFCEPPREDVFAVCALAYHTLIADRLKDAVTRTMGSWDGAMTLTLFKWEREYAGRLELVGAAASAEPKLEFADWLNGLALKYAKNVGSTMQELVRNIIQHDRTVTPDTNAAGNLISMSAVDTFKLVDQQIMIAAQPLSDVLLGKVCAEIKAAFNTCLSDLLETLKQPDGEDPLSLEYVCMLINNCQESMKNAEAVQDSFVMNLPQMAVLTDFDSIVNSYYNVCKEGLNCIRDMIFQDCSPLVSGLFKKTWAEERCVDNILATVGDFFSDIEVYLVENFFKKLVTEVLSELVVVYISRLCAGRTSWDDSFVANFREDIAAVQKFFTEYKPKAMVEKKLEPLQDVADFLESSGAMLLVYCSSLIKKYDDITVPVLERLLLVRTDVDKEARKKTLEGCRKVLDDKKHSSRSIASRQGRRQGLIARMAAAGESGTGQQSLFQRVAESIPSCSDAQRRPDWAADLDDLKIEEDKPETKRPLKRLLRERKAKAKVQPSEAPAKQTMAVSEPQSGGEDVVVSADDFFAAGDDDDDADKSEMLGKGHMSSDAEALGADSPAGPCGACPCVIM